MTTRHTKELTIRLSPDETLDIVCSKDRLFEFNFFHTEERHAERLQRILDVSVVKDNLKQTKQKHQP